MNIKALSLIAILPLAACGGTSAPIMMDAPAFNTHAAYMDSLAHIPVPDAFQVNGLDVNDFVAYEAATANIKAFENGGTYDASMIETDLELITDINRALGRPVIGNPVVLEIGTAVYEVAQ